MFKMEFPLTVRLQMLVSFFPSFLAQEMNSAQKNDSEKLVAEFGLKENNCK